MKKAGIIAVGCILVLGLLVGGPIMSWLSGASQVAQQEFSAQELLRKYTWFKDASATLDKKRADIKVYDMRITMLEADYDGIKRRDWARDDRELMGVWHSEVAGVKASYNSLAGEYNAQMSKANWAFTNAGSLPKGATEVLPREIRSYVEN